jgi:hypothetical protein
MNNAMASKPLNSQTKPACTSASLLFPECDLSDGRVKLQLEFGRLGLGSFVEGKRQSA